MTNRKYLLCTHCKNMVGVINDSGVKIVCCGEPMMELEVGKVEASHEKHIPDAKYADGKIRVSVGSVEHPMLPEHYIEWIAIASNGTTMRKALKPGDKPYAEFAVEPGIYTVYAYCNLHGLWAAEIS